ncbi:MAG: DUF1579 domain-containing protein [Polyangiaceae bacterium]|jgi:hypothetical protein|nr:DUF1579 domain-containing protein [Polyangiaceae bacterium]
MVYRPKPNEHHARLHALLGDWEGDETLKASPWGPGGGAVGRFTNSLAIDGFYVISDYVEYRKGRVAFRGHGVYGWDDVQRTYVWWWFDSVGIPSYQPARGDWHGDQFVMVLEQGGAQVRYTHTFEAEGRFRFTIESSQDGKSWGQLMVAHYRRVG